MALNKCKNYCYYSKSCNNARGDAMSVNVEFLDLRAFLAVFDSGSFRQAAEKLHLSQPAFSRRVQALESRLAMLLFERSTRRVTPTPAARKFEPLARRTLDEFDAGLMTMTGVGNSSNDQVVIASIPAAATHFLPQAIRQLGLQHPHVKVRILECMPEQGLDWVRSGEAELCLNLIGATEADVKYTHLSDDPYVFVCHRSHTLANKRTIRWSDLRTHPLIRMGHSPDSGRAVESRVLLDHALSKMNVQLDWRYEAHHLSTVLGLVEAGLGASIVPELAAPDESRSHIVARSIHPKVVTRAIGILERPRGMLSPAARCLRDVLLSGRASIKEPKGRTTSRKSGRRVHVR